MTANRAHRGGVLIQMAAVRGAVHWLMIEVLTGHLQEHFVARADEQCRASEMAVMTNLMRTYIK